MTREPNRSGFSACCPQRVALSAPTSRSVRPDGMVCSRDKGSWKDGQKISPRKQKISGGGAYSKIHEFEAENRISAGEILTDGVSLMMRRRKPIDQYEMETDLATASRESRANPIKRKPGPQVKKHSKSSMISLILTWTLLIAYWDWIPVAKAYL